MENIAEKMQSLLYDEEGIKQLQSLYNLLTENEKNDEPRTQEDSGHTGCNEEAVDSQENAAGNFDIGLLLKLQSLFSSGQSENRNTALLLALKPHLSDERKERVDKAVKILNLLETITVLKESGLLDEMI